MSTAFDEPDMSDDGLLAAEYALRLLGPEATLAARGREASDAGFAREVAGWNARLAALYAEVAPVQPGAATWARIVAAIRPSMLEDEVAPIVRKRKLVPAAIALAASVALVVGAWALVRPDAAPVASTAVAQPLLASLASEGGPVLASARYDIAGGTLSLTPAARAPGAGRNFEFWIVPADGRPRSLGVLAAGAPLRIALADDLAALFTRGATLAISEEATGGSRTGQPVGPIVASGKLGSA